MTTRSPPARPLASVNVRPIAGDTPIVSKNSGVTRNPVSCAGSPLPVRVMLAPKRPDIRSNDPLAVFQS